MGVALLACVIAIVWLIAARAYLLTQRNGLSQSLAEREAQVQSLTTENHKLGRDIAVALETNRGLEKQFEQVQRQTQETFKALAGDVLKQSTEQFLHLAKKSFEGEQKDAAAQLEQRKQAIEALVKPVREQLELHAKAVAEIEKTREGAYHGLRQQVTSMVEDQRRLQTETANLVKALRRPDVRGRWGELQLRRVAELAGMIDRCDFSEQVTGVDSEGRSRRPDMVVHLPAGRDIVVDSKTPIEAYLAAIEAQTDELRDQEMHRFVRHVEEKITDLASKNYHSQFERSPDFVVLFIPGEAFLQAALYRKPELLEQAFSRNVIIATPTTLISLLKVIELGWREEGLAENAQKISELGQELHKRLSTMCGHLANLGQAVGKAVDHYNKLVGSFESQVLVQARRFEELGVESPRKLPDEGQSELIEIQPREVRISA